MKYLKLFEDDKWWDLSGDIKTVLDRFGFTYQIHKTKEYGDVFSTNYVNGIRFEIYVKSTSLIDITYFVRAFYNGKFQEEFESNSLMEDILSIITTYGYTPKKSIWEED
jgi:hypothetical protein